jgi:hypothetical protein
MKTVATGGNIGGFIAIKRDVTARRSAEDAQRFPFDAAADTGTPGRMSTNI